MTSPGISNLPPDLQAIIQAEIARALAAAAPPPPKELTPQERAELLLAQAAIAERGDKAIASGSGAVHQAIFDVLAILVKHVFAPKDSGNDAPTVPSPSPANSTAAVETTGV